MSFIVCADAVEWLASLAPESVDLVVTDPAYESLEKHRKVGTTTRLKASDASSNEWFPIFGNERFADLLSGLFRVLKNGTHCYLICDQDTMFVVHDLAPKAGFTWQKFLVWDKEIAGLGYNWRAQHEVICFLKKGKRSGDAAGCLNDNTTSDVLRCNAVRGGYPTEKPVPMLRTLIRMSSNQGDLVIDPFAGSGSTGEAALRIGRKFAGCDVKESAVVAANARLGAVLNPAQRGLFS